MENLNTDKIYAEQLAGEYAPKDTTKVMAMHKLDQQASRTRLRIQPGNCRVPRAGRGHVPYDGCDRQWVWPLFVVGVIAGLVGIAGICVNYPPYNRLIQRGKERYGADIVRLAQEISAE